MVIYDFDIIRIAITPNKTYPPLVIDPDTMLPQTTTFQSFKPVSRWDP